MGLNDKGIVKAGDGALGKIGTGAPSNALARATAPIARPHTADPRARDLAERVPVVPKGPLTYVIDATDSRSGSWAEITKIQEKMFGQGAEHKTRVICHRGNRVEDLGTFANGTQAASVMKEICTIGGGTQIADSLRRAEGASCVIMIGDCSEDDEAEVKASAEFLRDKGIKVFSIHDALALPKGWKIEDEPNLLNGRKVYEKVAQITGGSCVNLDHNVNISGVLKAITAYDTGGADALRKLIASGDSAAKALADGNRKLLEAGNPNGPR
jgi:hypothetical protein